jgi:hypothetical protein
MLRSNIRINDNGFVFAYDLGTTFTTNRTGVEILKLLQQGRPKEEIGVHVVRTFGITPLEFEKDYQDFLVQLKNLRLLV